MINQTKWQSSKSSGFTLIELLISISILSMLLFTASYSYSLISSRWDKELGQFSVSQKSAKNLEITQRLLEGIQSHIVVDVNKKPVFFFVGHQDSLLAVSQSGFFSGDYPEIFRLTVVKKENGLVDLIYQSSTSENVLLTRVEQTIEFSKSLLLFSDLESIKFEYYGWRHITEKTDDDKKGFVEVWSDRYSGIDSQLMPSSLRLILTKNDKILNIPIDLQVDSEEWLSPYFERDS
ncbi:MAG: type II secretion system protein [Colwellia sp.]|nr:type II secretion system protein [Colwellia sp.]